MYQDLQIKAILADAVEYMRSDPQILALYDEPARIVNSILFRDPVVPVRDKGYRVNGGSPPMLCMWREGGHRVRGRLGRPHTEATVDIAWLDRVPGTGSKHDSIVLARNKADCVAHSLFEAVETLLERRYEYVAAAGIVDAVPLEYTPLGAWKEGLLGFTATVKIQHIKPPYAVSDMPYLDSIDATLTHYDSTTTSTSYTLDADTEGLVE